MNVVIIIAYKSNVLLTY